MVACALLGVPVVDCNPAAQQYAAAAAKVPREHWALVKEIEVSDEHETGKAHRDGHIRIPAELHPGQLWHEVSHLISWANGDALLDAYAAKFWPKGKPRNPLPSDYARHSAAEDFAEVGRLIFARKMDRRSARFKWMMAHVQGLPTW